MLTIYKYTIPDEIIETVPEKDYFSLNLPLGAEILTVQVQKGKPQIWALVETKNSLGIRRFLLATTGNPIKGKSVQKEKLNYIGTFQLIGGAFIGHLFEIQTIGSTFHFLD